MQIVEPNPSQFILPPGTRRIAIAEDQPEYQTLPALVTEGGKVASQWKPDANELAMLNRGVPLTLVVYTFGQPLQPVFLAVGGVDLTNG